MSPEDLGLPVLGGELSPISDRQMAAMDAVREICGERITEPLSTGLSGPTSDLSITEPLSTGLAPSATEPPCNINIETGSVISAEVAERLNCSPRAAQKLLNRLTVDDWIRRVGERRGWCPGPGPALCLNRPMSNSEAVR